MIDLPHLRSYHSLERFQISACLSVDHKGLHTWADEMPGLIG